MLQGPSYFLVSSVQFLVPSSCVLDVASELSNLFTSSYSFLVVTIWCTSWVLPRSAPSICQISLLYSSDPQKSTIPAPHCRCLSVTLSREPLKLYSSFVFRFPLLSVLVRLSLQFISFCPHSNFFLIICCLYLLEWFFFNLSATMCFRWSRACSFPFQEPSTSSFYLAHAIFYCSRLFSISSVSSVFL